MVHAWAPRPLPHLVGDIVVEPRGDHAGPAGLLLLLGQQHGLLLLLGRRLEAGRRRGGHSGWLLLA